jgi:hypothetical protein
VGRGIGPWAGLARPEIQTGRAGPKFKQYGPFQAWAGPGRAARMYTYKGPFIIAKILKPETYKLANSQGEVYSNAWNIRRLRRFYP